MDAAKPDSEPEARNRTFHDRLALTGQYGHVAELTVITGDGREPYVMLDAGKVSITFHLSNLAELVEVLHRALHHHLDEQVRS